MGINFPLSPSVGTLHPNPAVPGMPQYSWDGQKWNVAITGYAEYVQKSGDTMTGTLHAPSVTLEGGLPLLTFTPASGSTNDGYIYQDGDILTIAGETGAMALQANIANGTTIIPGAQNSSSPATGALQVTGGVGVGGAIHTPTPAQTVKNTQVPTTEWVKTWAAPFDAMAYNGMQVNGSMIVGQEHGSTPVMLGNTNLRTYVVDGFIGWTRHPTATLFHGGRDAGGVIVPGGILPAATYLACSTTPAPTFTTNDFAQLATSIEGYRVARLAWGTPNAQPITISFYVWAPVAGHFSVCVRDSTETRCYLVDVAINAATTWEFKQITVPGCVDGAGWYRNSNTGLMILWNFGCGPALQGAPNVWHSNVFFATTATTNNFFGTANNVVYLTGVTVMPGIEGPAADRVPHIMRPYDQELITCQRYFWMPNSANAPYKSFAVLQGITTTNAVGPIQYPVTMRGVPTITYSAPSTFGFAVAITADVIDDQNFRTNLTVSAGQSAPNAAVSLAANAVTTAFIKCSTRM